MKSAAFFALLTFCVHAFALADAPESKDTLVWDEFVAVLKAGQLTQDRIRPYEGVSKETLIGWLKTLSEEVPIEQLQTPPEMHRVGDQLHCLTTLGGVTFCLTFLLDGTRWYFRHIETIVIRLDRIDSLPATQFPDISEEQKAWIREELYWSQVVLFYGIFAGESGREEALSRFKDGAGYFMAAKAWVPFVPPQRAFVLYMCWEQANLRGNKVTLERLDDAEATVRFPRLQYFELYERASHLRQQISFEDYRRIFETIWQDRANNAGWNLQISTEPNGECVFHLTRK